MSIASVIKDYGPAVPWILVAGGWIISNIQANRRELRKEVRSEIVEIEAIIKAVGKELRTYYGTEPATDKSHEHALNIKVSMKELDGRFDRLFSRNLGQFPTDPPLSMQDAREAFFDAVTGAKFESATRPKGDELRLILAKQHTAGLTLVEGLHSAFLQEFK